MFRALILVASVGIVSVLAIEMYSDQFDHLDVDTILADDAERDKYYDCFMDKGPCHTPDAVYFKDKFPEALVTKCQRCTDKQKKMVEKVVIWYIANQEEKWNALITKLLSDARAMKLAEA